MDTDRKFSKKSSMPFFLLVLIEETDEICYTRYRGIWEENSSLSLYPKIFDYSLGGYYHRERWSRTRRYYQMSYYVMDEGRKIYLSLYSKHVFDYSLGGTPIGSAGRAPDENFKNS
jgi:hypothetical protein